MSENNITQKPKKDNHDTDFSTTDYAVALKYDKDRNDAPVVTAKGQGEIAAKIIALAEEHGIEIHQDADLLQVLKAVNIDEEIPIEAFAAVAEVLSFIYSKNNAD